jgi:hypothetical protein
MQVLGEVFLDICLTIENSRTESHIAATEAGSALSV